MAQIFTWNEVQKHHIPSIKDFPKMMDFIKKELGSNDMVLGALFYGSSIGGNYSVRSDIDFLVVYADKGQSDLYYASMVNIFQKARKLNIPIEALSKSVHICKTQMHNVDSRFRKHLELGVEQCMVIKKNPLDFISAIKQENVYQLTRGFLSNRLNKLTKGCILLPVMSEEEMCRFAGESFRATNHTARIMSCFMFTDKYDNIIREDGNFLENFLYRIKDKEEAIGIPRIFLHKLIEINKRYNNVLESQAKRPSHTAYQEMLQEIKNFLPEIALFVEYSCWAVDKQSHRHLQLT